MHCLLDLFKRPTAVEALELLDSKFPDAKVRAPTQSISKESAIIEGLRVGLGSCLRSGVSRRPGPS